MHIVFVTNELATRENSSGGLATFTANIARVFYNYNHEVTVIYVTTKEHELLFDEGIRLENVYVDKRDWEEYDFVSRLYVDGDEAEAINKRREWIRMRKCELVRDKIYEIDRENKIDIVHFCNHGSFSLLMHSDIPYIIRISGFTNILRGANELNGSLECTDNPLTVTEQLEIHAMQKTKYIVTPSKLLADIAKKNFGVEATVLESPFVSFEGQLDPSVFEKRLKGKKYIIFYGTLHYLKGIEVVAKLAERFLETHLDMYLVLAGNDRELEVEPGNLILASEYVKKSARKWADKVIYVGRLVREQLYPIVQNAELCLLPSRIENLSNACIEAMAFGKIVVATDGASYEQLIVDRENGYLCERDNPDSFLEAIEEGLKSSEEQKEKMIAKAKERIRKLSPDKVYENYYNYYQKAIKEWKLDEKNERTFDSGKTI